MKNTMTLLHTVRDMLERIKERKKQLILSNGGYVHTP